MLTEPK